MNVLNLPLDNPMQTKALVSIPSTIVPSVPSFPRGRSLQAEGDYTSLPSFGGVRRIIYESMFKSELLECFWSDRIINEYDGFAKWIYLMIIHRSGKHGRDWIWRKFIPQRYHHSLQGNARCEEYYSPGGIAR